MLTRTTKFALALAALATLALAPTTAKAQHGHQSYKYTGQLYHFDSEGHMVKALEILELTYWEQNDFVRHDLVELAHREITSARSEAKSGSARQYLQLADTYIHYFETTCSQVYLDRAAYYIRYALQFEAQVCVPHYCAPKHVSYPPSWGHGHGHQGGHHGGGFPYQQQFKGGNVNFSKGGVHIGGKKGGFTIKW